MTTAMTTADNITDGQRSRRPRACRRHPIRGRTSARALAPAARWTNRVAYRKLLP